MYADLCMPVHACTACAESRPSQAAHQLQLASCLHQHTRMQATRQLEVIAGLNPSSQTPAPSKGSDLLNPRPPASAASVAPVAAAGAGSAAAAGAGNAAAGQGFVSAVDEFESSHVPEGPDAAVLEFAVALAHHHDAITGERACDENTGQWCYQFHERSTFAPRVTHARRRSALHPVCHTHHAT